MDHIRTRYSRSNQAGNTGHLGSRFLTVWQVSRHLTRTESAFSLVSFDDTEVNRTYTYQFYRPLILQMNTNSHVFLGMLAHAQAVDTRPLSLLPRGLGTRLDYSVLCQNGVFTVGSFPIIKMFTRIVKFPWEFMQF